MAHIHKEVTVNADPDRVWAAVRDVGAVHERLARGFVVDTRLDGDVREMTFSGGAVVRERIVAVDDRARRLAYSIVGGRPTQHNASMQVVDDGGGRSRIIWITELLPDALTVLFSNLMNQGCAAMKATFEDAAKASHLTRRRQSQHQRSTNKKRPERTMNAQQNPLEVALTECQPQPVLSIRATVPVARLAEVLGEGLRELWSFMRRRGVKAVGPPFVRYHTFSEIETDLEVGVPVDAGATGEGGVARSELSGGTAITTWHLGAHDRLGEAYQRLRAWLGEHGREADGAAWEVYWWIDPGAEPDSSTWPPRSEWRTQLVQLLK